MKNRIHIDAIHPDELAARCTEIILSQGVIAVPTDTVYGLICQWDCLASLEKMAAVKEREWNKPFAVFTDSWERVEPLLIKPCDTAKKLAQHFWDGGLTIIIPVDRDCPCSVDGKLGVRSPAYPLIHNIIQQSNTLLANTSFNRSGEPTLSSIPKDHPLLSKVDLVIDAGGLGEPVPSTVVDCTGEKINVLREGVILSQEIHCLLG